MIMSTRTISSYFSEAARVRIPSSVMRNRMALRVIGQEPGI